MEINENYTVSSLAEYMEAINGFSRGDIVWYRGHANYQYTLLPTLYRGITVDFAEEADNSVHYLQSMRMQQYHARNYMFIKEEDGTNLSGLLGNAQHFQLKTRFLDWSTSAIHSLLFALEKYFDPPAEDIKGIPCVWLLKPQKMNEKNIKKIWEHLKNNMENLNRLGVPESLIDSINANQSDYVFLSGNPVNSWSHMDFIYNLAYLESCFKCSRENPDFTISETRNPIFHILSKIYLEGEHITCNPAPLAVLHPLNSDRIHMQNGVFTVFPFPQKELYEKNGMNYMRMEYRKDIRGTLGRVMLCEPERIGRELRTIGVHRSWLYFEQEQLTREIESGL